MPITRCSFIAVLAAALSTMSVVAGTAHAQDCLHWGDLDNSLYCDENRDLVADTPSQGFRLQDPDTLVFSYSAYDSLSSDKDVFSEFLNHVSKKTGKQLRWSQATSSASQIKAMRAGEIHLAAVAPGPTVYAVNLAGYVPIAVMCKDDDTFGYQVQVITKKDSDFRSFGDLKGRKVAQTSALANTGEPPAEGYQSVYSGSQNNSIGGVTKGTFDAAFVDSNVLERAQNHGLSGARDARVIWSSRSYPSTSFGIAHNLTPELQRTLHDAFLTFDWEGSALAREFGTEGEKFCTISYADTWQPIRRLQKENGVVYSIKDL